ncbi:MAG: VWA domain-containing protein [Pseudomonadota bacterium]
MTAPREIRPFLRLATALRQQGFVVGPDQTIGFLESVDLLGPRSIGDVRDAGAALFAIPPERQTEYEAIFRAIFHGQSVAAPAGETEDDTDVMEVTGAEAVAEIADEDHAAAEEASALDAEGTRIVQPADDARILARFVSLAAERLPRRRVLRRRRAASGDRLDLRRTLRNIAKYDGDFADLGFTRRKTRQHRIVFLIDVSGSMQDFSAPALRMAHTLVTTAERAEVFSIGTRLTRLTPALTHPAADIALARASSAVTDFDRGTRLGDALLAFLGTPRFAGLARGSWVVVYSDGLERDAPDNLVAAAARLARVTWRFSWLTPLAPPGTYQPATAGLAAIEPHLNALEGAPDLEALGAHFLTGRRAA